MLYKWLSLILSVVQTFFTFGISCLFITACGVKGPPLPPLAVTPQQPEVQQPKTQHSSTPGSKSSGNPPSS